MSEDVAVERVEHHRRGEAFEEPGVDHPDLAASTFLRRSTEEHHLASNLLRDGRSREERADGARGDEVVPACMPDVRKCVVLAEDRDARSLRVATPRA